MTSNRASTWAILAILILATSLRLIKLQERPMWYDEAFSLLLAQQAPAVILDATLGSEPAASAEEHPPLYYLLLHGWMRLVAPVSGVSELAVARLLSVVVSVATVGLLYALGRRLWDAPTGLAAALAMAMGPFPLYYAQEARMYALLALATTATTACLVWGWRGGGLWAWGGYVVSAVVALYTHNMAVIYIVVLGLWIAWQWIVRGDRRHLRPIILTHIVLLALYVPWLMFLPRQLGKLTAAYWVTTPGLVDLIQTVFVFHFAADNQGLPPGLLPSALALGLVILVLSLMELAPGRDQPSAESNLRAARFVGWQAFGAVGLTFAISLVQPIYVLRGLLPAALIYYLLVARLLVAGRPPRLIRGAVVAGAIAVIVASGLFHYQYTSFPRSPFPEAVAYLEQAIRPGDIIVHSNKLTFLPAYAYAPELPQAFLADDPDSGSDTLSPDTQAAIGIRESLDIEAATEGASRVWLVVFQRALSDVVAAGDEEHPDLDWLKARYGLAERHDFGDLIVYRFEPASAAVRTPSQARQGGLADAGSNDSPR